jgi:hypothetical protein
MIFVHNGRKYTVNFATYYFKADATTARLRGVIAVCDIDFPSTIVGLGTWQIGETVESLKSYQVLRCTVAGRAHLIDLELLVDQTLPEDIPL